MASKMKRAYISWGIYFAIVFCCFYGCNTKQNSKEIQLHIHWAIEYSIDGLDYFFDKYKPFVYSDGRKFPIGEDRFCVFTEEQQQIAKDILSDYFSYYKYENEIRNSRHPYALRKYFRQHVGYKDNGHIMDCVNLYTHQVYRKAPNCLCLFIVGDWSWQIINAAHGGIHYGTVIIDVTERQVVSFSLNPEPPKREKMEYGTQKLPYATRKKGFVYVDYVDSLFSVDSN